MLLAALTSALLPGAFGQLDRVSDAAAAEVHKSFLAEYASKDDRLRLAAVDRIGSIRHALAVKGLMRALQDGSPLVRAAAAERLAGQDPKTAAPPLHGAWKADANQAAPDVLIAVLKACRRLDQPPGLEELTRRFERAPVPLKIEIVRTAATIRQLGAVEFLAANLDPPAPANVDDPTNPPADYWKERWEFWNACHLDVQSGLKELTGQDFGDAAHVKAWLRKGGKVLPKPKTNDPPGNRPKDSRPPG